MVRKNVKKKSIKKKFLLRHCLLFLDLKTLKVLNGFSNLFPPFTARKKTKNIKEWRPSKAEIQEGFVLHVKVSHIFLLFYCYQFLMCT